MTGQMTQKWKKRCCLYQQQCNRNMRFIQMLNLWTLEERRNRQDLIEVFKISKRYTRINPNYLFYFDNNGKGTRGHSFKLVKPRCTRDSRKHFTALHGMQSRYGDGNSVCLSVRLSNACIVTKRKKAMFRFLCHMKEHLS